MCAVGGPPFILPNFSSNPTNARQEMRVGLFDELQNVLTQYAAGNNAAPQNAQDVEQHFSQIAAAAPQSSLAEGLAAAFHSNQTPAFGEMLSSLFSQSNGDQKAGLLNQLMASMPPGAIQSLLGAGAASGPLASLLQSGSAKITPEQAQQISPEAVQKLAASAEQHDPSIIDTASQFYAQHSTLIKTLGGVAMTLALSHIAERQAQK